MRKDNTQTLRDILHAYFKTMGLEHKLVEQEVLEAWPEVAGPMIMRYVTSIEFRNQTLYVALKSGTMRNELLMNKNRFVQSLNTTLGYNEVKDIVFR